MSRFIRCPGRSALVVLLLIAVAGLSSCGKKQETTENTTSNMPDTAGQMSSMAPAMTDGNIVAVVKTANDADIDNGNAAKGITKNSKVRAFAEQMVTDHTSVNKQIDDLKGRLNINPEDNDASRNFKTMADAQRDSLKKLKGAEFDRAYIDAEIAVHQQVLDMLDNTLIPSAQNADLKTLLQNARPTISAHLDHAKQVQAGLGGNP
jgi:putative membrane protein